MLIAVQQSNKENEKPTKEKVSQQKYINFTVNICVSEKKTAFFHLYKIQEKKLLQIAKKLKLIKMIAMFWNLHEKK